MVDVTDLRTNVDSCLLPRALHIAGRHRPITARRYSYVAHPAPLFSTEMNARYFPTIQLTAK